jgi:hypothetical protein
MKYTLAEGVDRKEENIQRGLLVSLPIIFAVLLLALLGINQPAKKSPGTKPTQSASSQSPSSSNNSNSGSLAASTTPPPSVQTQSGGLQVSSPLGSVGTSQPIIGGRGGGGILPPPPSPSPTPTPTPPPPIPTLPPPTCVDVLGQQINCSVCTNPLVLQDGKKYLVQIDGTCVVIN